MRNGGIVYMKQGQYVNEGGTRCPYCRSMDVHETAKYFPGEEGEVLHPLRCYECGRGWNEVYRLKGWAA